MIPPRASNQLELPGMPRHTGIPTFYAGVWFRSRAEARWAAVFDLLGWRWRYELIDLPGYIPDFILTDFGILVEVKGGLWDVQPLLLTSFRLMQTMRAADWNGRVLFLGAAPVIHGDWELLGFGVAAHDLAPWPVFLVWCERCSRWLPNRLNIEPTCRACRSGLLTWRAAVSTPLERKWREASAVTQWKKPHHRPH